jgi:hypothetical protein
MVFEWNNCSDETRNLVYEKLENILGSMHLNNTWGKKQE